MTTVDFDPADLGVTPLETEGQPDDGKIEVGGVRYTPQELAEAVRYKEQDYPNLQRRFSQAQEEVRQKSGRLAELEDMVANLGTAQEPYGQPVEPYYGQPGLGQGQPPYAPDMVQAIAAQVERAIAPRLAAVQTVTRELQGLREQQEQMRRTQQRLVEIESEYTDLRDRHGLGQAELNGVAAIAKGYQDRTGQYLAAEEAYHSYMFQEATKEETTAAGKRRKRASAAAAGSAEPVVLPEKTPQTEAEWGRFADKVLADITEGGEL